MGEDQDETSGATLEDLMREAFLDVPLHQLLGLEVVDVGRPGTATMAFPLTGNAVGRTGQLHGGAISLLCDLACAAAASTASTYDAMTTALVTADLHVRYLGAAKGDRVRAEANVVKAGRTLIVVQAEVTDGMGRVVAVADFSAMLVPHRAPLDLPPA
jgi:uncharacterized protein (TIGR00369 family)